jgi:hypothetical protein
MIREAAHSGYPANVKYSRFAGTSPVVLAGILIIRKNLLAAIAATSSFNNASVLWIRTRIRSACALAKPIPTRRASNETGESIVNATDERIRIENDVCDSHDERGQPESSLRINPTDQYCVERQESGINDVKQNLIPVEGLNVLPIGGELLTARSLCGCHIPPNQVIVVNPINLAHSTSSSYHGRVRQ